MKLQYAEKGFIGTIDRDNKTVLVFGIFKSVRTGLAYLWMTVDDY